MRILKKDPLLNVVNDTAIFYPAFFLSNIYHFFKKWGINVLIPSFLGSVIIYYPLFPQYINLGGNILLKLISSIFIYWIFLYILEIKKIPEMYKRYKEWGEKRLISFLMEDGGNKNPFKMYTWFYLLFLLIVRYFYVWLTEKNWRIFLFSTISSYSMITIIGRSENPFIVAFAFVFPLLFILMDIRSSVVAAFFKKNPQLTNQLFNSLPKFIGGGGDSSSSPNRNFKRGMRRAVEKGVDAVGGPKAVITGLGLAAGSVFALWRNEVHHQQDIEQNNIHHQKDMEQNEVHHQKDMEQNNIHHEKDMKNSNQLYAMEKKMSAEYQSLPIDSPIKKEIDNLLITGKFPENK